MNAVRLAAVFFSLSLSFFFWPSLIMRAGHAPYLQLKGIQLFVTSRERNKKHNAIRQALVIRKKESLPIYASMTLYPEAGCFPSSSSLISSI